MHVRKNGKPVAVETRATWQGRPIILCVDGGVVKVREKGRRQWYLWPVERIYIDAVKAEVASRKKTRTRKPSRGLLTI